MWPYDQRNHNAYEQYARAYDDGGDATLDSQQALGHVQQFMCNAPAELQQQLFQQHFEQMPYEQRAALAQQMPPHYNADPNDSWSMAQNMHRLGQEQPHILQRLFAHPLLLGGAVGIAGLIAKHMLSQRA